MHYCGRLGVISGMFASLFMLSPIKSVAQSHFGIADQFQNDSTQNIEQRLTIYKQAHIGILRADVEWRSLETSVDHWQDPSNLTFLKIAQKQGFLLKLCVGSMQGPPSWYFELHPDAQLANSQGLRSRNVISYWYPGLRALLEEKDRKLFQYLSSKQLLDAIEYIVIPFGPACEDIYPVPWTTEAPNSPMQFWFYDSNAIVDFPKKMKSKYRSLKNANLTWGTSYTSWAELSVLKARSNQTRMWQDLLTWYRDQKRIFVAWQINHYKQLVSEFYPNIRRPRLVLLIPGSHRTGYDNEQALTTAGGTYATKAMIDTEFTLDMAHQTAADVQYTGLPNLQELEYIQQYQVSRHYGLRVWGENAGNQGDPFELDQEILISKLFGQEYIGSNLFGADRVTKTSLMQRLIDSHNWLTSQWNLNAQELVTLSEIRIVQGGCIFSGAQGLVSLCLQRDLRLTLSINGRKHVITNVQTSHKRCPKNEDPATICTATFQLDGNFVVRMGDRVVWSSDTQHRGSHLVLSSKNPYLMILDHSDKPIWSVPHVDNE